MSARLLRIALPAIMATLVVACTVGDKNNKPAELTDFQSTAKVERLWSVSVGSSAPKLRLGLSLAVSGDDVFVANHSGEVVAFSQANGKRLWQTATKLPLTGGPGAGEGLVVAGASHGHLVALDAATGKVKWKSYINSELLSAPVMGKDMVLLRTVDGRVVALKATDGTQLWSAEQTVPRLSLRGTARPSIVGDEVLSGFDNGRVMALQLSDGGTVWDANVSPATGSNELQRLNDIDTALEVRGNDVFVVTFQGKAARLDLDTGKIQWSRDLSSYSGLALDDDGLYITSADGAVVKLASSTGVETWNSKTLSHRRLSPPVVLGNWVVVGDLDGYVHFIDRATGALAARIHALSDRVSAAPVVSGETVFMLDASGHIVALRATPVALGKGTKAPAGAGNDNSPSRPR